MSNPFDTTFPRNGGNLNNLIDRPFQLFSPFTLIPSEPFLKYSDGYSEKHQPFREKLVEPFKMSFMIN